MIALISCLSLKSYLNSAYDQNIIGSSPKVFNNLRKSSENVRGRLSLLRNNFGKSSQIFGKWSVIFGKSSKAPSSVWLCNKKYILLHITREFYSIKLICTNLYALFSHVKKAYTANQNCVQLFHMWKYDQSTIA